MTEGVSQLVPLLPPKLLLSSHSLFTQQPASVILLTPEPFHVTLLQELLITLGVTYKDLTMTFKAPGNLTVSLFPLTACLLYCSFFFRHIPRIFDLFVNLQTRHTMYIPYRGLCPHGSRGLSREHLPPPHTHTHLGHGSTSLLIPVSV